MVETKENTQDGWSAHGLLARRPEKQLNCASTLVTQTILSHQNQYLKLHLHTYCPIHLYPWLALHRVDHLTPERQVWRGNFYTHTCQGISEERIILLLLERLLSIRWDASSTQRSCGGIGFGSTSGFSYFPLSVHLLFYLADRDKSYKAY